ncbi:MAG: ABC transporter ATP-binding protein [Spirochaetia bacterium]|nr:ABC transporter ATP-binding protein [Spirochaetia bacterium]
MMLLETKKLNKIYESGKVKFQALYNVDLAFNEGEFSALVGPSGSGKTTLLNCMGCIDKPESGEIFLEGENLTQKNSAQQARVRKEKYGFIFQTYNLMPVLNVYENVELPMKLLKKHSDKEIKDMVYKILDEVGLKGLEKRMPLELSGGQQQRVSVARALIKKPKVIFADEPTANLDSKTGEAIIDLMHELNEVEKVTFIFSTHDKMVMKHARRIIELKDGRIA